MAKEQIVSNLINVLCVLLGFAMAAGWDVWKTGGAERDEIQRAARSVKQEIAINRDLIRSNMEILDQDSIAADTRKQVIVPVIPLATAAGEMAYLKGSFEKKKPDLAIKLRGVYSAETVVNRHIEARALYISTNEAMGNFDNRRKLLNTNIKSILVDVDGDLAKLSQELNGL